MSELIHVSIDFLVRGEEAVKDLYGHFRHREVWELNEIDDPNIKYLGIYQEEWLAHDLFKEGGEN